MTGAVMRVVRAECDEVELLPVGTCREGSLPSACGVGIVVPPAKFVALFTTAVAFARGALNCFCRSGSEGAAADAGFLYDETAVDPP